MAIVHTPSVKSITTEKNETIEIPAKYFILGIVILPDASNAVDNFAIGTTALGQEVFASFTLGNGSEYVTKNPAEGSKCWVAAKTLYIKATSWNGAEITVYFLLQKLNGQ